MGFPKRKREEEQHRDWKNLPRDILFEIYQRIDGCLKLRRLRSVCSCWRSSLLPLTSSSTSLKFPLKLPPPSFLKPESKLIEYNEAYLSQSDLFIFPSPPGHKGGCGWIVRVEQLVESNRWHLQNPYTTTPASFEHPRLFKGSFDIFECNIKEITRCYSLEYSTRHHSGNRPKEAKAVVYRNNNNNNDDDFTVLVLFKVEGKLGLWRPGETCWSVITDPLIKNNFFCDIITFSGKFYATTKLAARLIMIDPTTYEVSDLMRENQLELKHDFPVPALVESNGRLYLVNTKSKNYILEAGSWKVVKNLDDCVFFTTNYVNFSVTAEDLGWSKGNYVLLPFFNYYGICALRFLTVDVDEDEDEDEDEDVDLIQELIDGKVELGIDTWPWAQYSENCLSFYSLQDSDFSRKQLHRFTNLFWPPPHWLLQLHFKYSPHSTSVSSVNTASVKTILQQFCYFFSFFF
ncbi:F-box protein SKIP23-like [Spinacia oleracea]|uniref:F-box protein SKIP23-like n=1 Tax=Spinacia oleracea TaxID=3562 RepID=A0A9R0IA36_SPIOL|nr:F-box protein SKIP23-like [Spinacia oleracea]